MEYFSRVKKLVYDYYNVSRLRWIVISFLSYQSENNPARGKIFCDFIDHPVKGPIILPRAVESHPARGIDAT
jgi:hypothetical protein